MELEFGWGVQGRTYGYSETHKYILEQFGEPYNIGENGENLTILLLSLNRSAATTTLLLSINDNIPNFAGEVLVVDNGSAEIEKDAVKKVLSEMPYAGRFHELDRNYGVAGGRNRGVAQAKTLWIMNVDNDMYFINNPLKEIAETISNFGCHFLNVPFFGADGTKLESNGGNLNFEEIDGKIFAGQGSMFKPMICEKNTVFEPSIGTYLYGAGSLYRKDTFELCGGYDEGMFVGFEDTDFSLTLFRKGYKIANCGKVCLVHNHEVPTDEHAKDAERARHSRERLKEAADYFEKKNNIHVWNRAVDNWLDEREKNLGLNSTAIKLNQLVNVKPWLPKIALVVDHPDWAFSHIADQIEKHLSTSFNFTRLCTSDIQHQEVAQVLFALKGFDLVHVFWRPFVNAAHLEWSLNYVRELGGDTDLFQKEYIDTINFSTSVYDHLYLQDEEFTEITVPTILHTNSYYTSSQKLDTIYKSLYQEKKIDKPPVAVLSDGVDLDLFKPINIERFKEVDKIRPLRVGWAGNSVWAAQDDLKGIHTVIKPAIESLKQQGYSIELVMQDRKDSFTPHEKMPQFYNDIDIYVCASSIEGTPNTVLEAMACGLAIISTDVGIVPEVFGKFQTDFILSERSSEKLEELLKRILAQPDWLCKLSCENLDQIQSWDWSKKVWPFKQYFDICLGRA